MPTEDGSGSPRPAPPTAAELVAAFPHLEILELIGQGGMGFVYKARQTKIERFVALKILPRSLAADAAFTERFTREGRVLARLNHPNIVTIHDFGQADGFSYLLMEFVDGVNLRQAMKIGRFTPAQALAIVPSICDALQFAHNEGVLHRDIKPENILLDSKGRVKIADFGIAKLMGMPPSDLAQTRSGATLGTPHYMAPEQLEHPGEVDHRADIYSLGVVFYEMLTGELPLGKFQVPSQKVHLDVRLDEVVLHALEKEPARRYQHVSQVKTAVDTIAATAAPVASSPGIAGPTSLRARVPSFWKGFAVGAVCLLVMLALLESLRHFIARKEPTLTPRGQQEGAPQIQPTPSPLVIDTLNFTSVNPPEPGELHWGFKCFVPSDHLASFLFVCWTNGVPTLDPGFSTYFKVGKTGGIDLFCTLGCHRVVDSSEFSKLTDDTWRKWLAAWSYPEAAGVSNAVRWDVNLGAGYTASRWIAMPPYQQVEFQLPQRLRSGHQRSLRLVAFARPEGDANPGQSGVELRILLEPLKSAAIRTAPYEVDHTNYIAGRGLAGTAEEMLRAIKTWPIDP